VHSWLFRNRARLAVLYGVAEGPLAPAPALRPALHDGPGGPELVPHVRRPVPAARRVR
jgi:hypothetical protein